MGYKKRPIKGQIKTLRYKVFSFIDGIHEGKYFPYKVDMKYLKIHSNHFHLMVGLSKCALSLLFYIVDVMDENDHQVINHPATRSDFINYALKHLSIKYEDLTVRRAFNELDKVGYLIKRDNDRRLVLNPLYISKGSEESREKLIRSLIFEGVDPRFRNEDIIKKLGIKRW